MVEERKSWNEMKHTPAKRSQVINPIRAILEKEMKPIRDHPKPMVNLGLGEPSKANGFDLPPVINEAIIEAVQSEKANSYTMSSGTIEARTAIAEKFSTAEHTIDPSHVMLTHGCSGALQNAVSVLCDQGDTILVPSPGFPLIQTICQNFNVNFEHYKLDSQKNWNIDIRQLKSIITPKVKAILLNNPSNPCGACWSKEHMLEILAVCDEYKIPIIADEVYYGLNYDKDTEFHSFGNLSENVPVIATGSISKIYCLPGWRCGWNIVYNKYGYFDDVLQGMSKQQMILLHPNSLVQAALPKILSEVPESHFQTLKDKLRATSEHAFELMSEVEGVTPIKSTAAMYLMCKIEMDHFKDIKDDIDFCKKLLVEQNCLTFPSQCFFEPGYFRMIICTTKDNMTEFAKRLDEFCKEHAKQVYSE